MYQTAPSGMQADSEQRFSEKVRLWEIIFLIVLSGSLLAAAAWQSRKEYFGNDELLTVILVSNPSFPDMMHTISRGGELNPPLLFIIEWVMARLFGTGEFAMRAVSAVSVSVATWVLYFTIRGVTGRYVAATAVALVMGLSRDVFTYSHDARYYGLLLLLVTTGFYLFVQLSGNRPVTARTYVQLFLLHLAMVYLHLYGLLYSGVLLVAIAVMDILVRRQLRWKLLASIVAAWVCFCAWLPSTFQQYKSIAQGVYEPPELRSLGFFLQEIELSIPFGLILLLVVVLGLLALISRRPNPPIEEAAAGSRPIAWTALIVGTAGLISIPTATWTASLFLRPAPFIHRYIFPCTVGWVMVVALVMAAVMRLPATMPSFKFQLPQPVWMAAWICVLAFCVAFQPLRAKKNPPRAAQAFVDPDFGHKDVTIAFENSWYFFQRVMYGKDRSYLMVIDTDAAEADPSWYTKNMERFFRIWYPKYQNANIAYFKDLPAQFVAVDDDYTKTFEWIFAHHPELKVELLGKRKSPHELYGEERIWFVQNPNAKAEHR